MVNQSVPEQSTTAATATTTQTSNAGRKRRSCLMCSKRKVKCDKQKPCTSCVKAGNECIFAGVGTNRNQVGMSPELVEMLHRLEKAVNTLEPLRSDRPDGVLPIEQPAVRDSHDITPAPRHESRRDDTAATTGVENSDGNDKADVENSGQRPVPQVTEASAKAPSVSSSQTESPGKIVRDHGKDTYVRRWFWDDGSTEISSGSLSEDDCDDDPRNQDNLGSAENPRSTIHSQQPKEKVLQTLISHRMNLWVIYKERVEPLTKLLHLPSLEQAVLQTQLLSSVDGIQCIVLAVYYGAVTSLSEEECILMFANSQAQVLSRMREELEKMFASADLIHTGDIRPLQALVLYLVFLRHHDPRLSWKLTGLAVRLAQNFGLHREDSFLGLSKFEADMRRRLWWQLAIIEAPSAEDYSGEYNLLEMGSFDTHPPLNLDDAQLYPIMTEYPAERRGLTEMTFTLARCQITSMYRCIADSRRLCGNTGKSYAELTPQERADWIDDCEAGFSDKFLRDSSPSSAFQWVTVILTRMLFHKVRLHGCKPLHGAAVTEDARERLFAVAVEVIELNYKLRTDPRTRPYLWLFSSYTQWHPFSLVLVWLQMDPLCKSARRAWEAVEKAVTLRWEHPPSLLNGRKPRQWKLIIRLMDKARSARREALSKRARKGSRSAVDLRQTSIRVPLGSHSSSVAAIQDSSAPTLASQIAQPQEPSQPQQHQHTTTAAAAGPSGPSGSEIAITGDSSLELQHGASIQNPWVSAYENPMPDFTVGNIVDPMSGQDLMLIDGEFSDDLEMQNFYLFDDIF